MDTKQVGFRMPGSLIDRLDAYAEKKTQEMTGCKVTRADAVRMLLEQGLEGFDVDPERHIGVDDAARDASIQATKDHRFQVRAIMLKVIADLRNRAEHHDDSKLEQPELDLFAEWGPKLGQMEYDSDEYRAALAEMGVALKHHYEHNSHHPEHFEGAGVDGMNLLDIIEMVCDWKASTMRVQNGNFIESLEKNRKRFKLSPQLVRIIANTADFFEPSGEPKLPGEDRPTSGIPWGKTAG